MSTIADRIKEICAQKGTSMYKLEKQLNLGNGTIGKWGKNGRQPTYDKAVAVASALGVPVSYLLEGKEQKEKPASEEAGFHPTLEDWLNAIDRMSREEMRAVMSRVMERYAGEDK